MIKADTYEDHIAQKTAADKVDLEDLEHIW